MEVAEESVQRRPPTPQVDSWFTCGRTLLLLLGFLLVSYPEIFRGTHTFFYRDFGTFGYPLAHYWRASLWRGEFPLWNPLSECGVPFAAQWTPMAFYPGSLLLAVLPLRWALGFFCLAHLLMAGGSMYLLAYRWTGNRMAASFAALTFAVNGMLLHSLMWPHYMVAFAWMPLVVFWLEGAVREGGRAVLAAAAAGTMQMFSGAPEPILFTWLVALLWTSSLCWQREISITQVLRRSGAIVALVSALCAVQLLPFIDLLLHSRRAAMSSDDLWSMPRWGIANYLVPLFHATAARIGVFTQDSQQLFSSYYLGVGTLVLAMWTVIPVRDLRVRLLAGGVCVALVFALGEQGGVYAVMKRVFPALGFVRYPVKWLILVTFALPLLAARGIAAWRAEEEEKQSAQSLVSIGVCLLAGIVWIARRAHERPVPFEVPSVTLNNAMVRAVVLAATIGFFVAWRRTRSLVRQRAFAALVLLVTGLDLITHTPRQNPLVLTQAYEPIELTLPVHPKVGESRAMMTRERRNLLEFIRIEDPFGFYLSVRRALIENCNLIEGVPILSGFWPLSLREYSEVAELIYKGTNAVSQGLVDFMGAAVQSSPATLGEWDPRPTALPLITGGQQPLFAGRDETLHALASPEFDPRRVVYLRPADRTEITAASNAPVRVTSGRITAHGWNFAVTADSPALVVISQAFYHPWTAFIDGQPRPLFHANHAFQALQIPAGAHAVQLRYIDWAFRAGLVVSVVALVLVAFLWRRFRGKPTRAAASS